MKRILKSKLELVLLISLAVSIFLMVVFNGTVLTGIALFVYSQLIPYNITFDEGVDKSVIDASQIINCLHGGGCPAGINYINDETGLKEEREVIPNQQQPVIDYSPESTGFPTTQNNVPDDVLDLIPSADIVVYFIYFLIVILFVVVIAILLKRRSKKPKTV